MINENDLLISNRSYINKDFAAIYPELISMAKKMSLKFDPETSNESDPFIVLIKLLAFVGDKLNYNADKNILERFMPSATQENTMRDLTSMLGYNMNYYIAPETEVYIKYVGKEEFTEQHQSFALEPLETIFTDASGDTQFVLIERCEIDGYNKTPLIGSKVLQGIKRRLSVMNNNSENEIILLENIDENNRVYFPEKKVAQNGVFISGGTMTSSDTVSGYWDKVDNLNTQPSGSYVYIFGYDSDRGYPYVQFPNDITKLIGDGLIIDYIITDGYSGNIGAKKLNTLKSPTSVYWSNSSDEISLVSDENTPSPLVITNTNGSINGADPEDINTAYVNYKKIIGTFDTLVTCRDFANAIYNLNDYESLFKAVSNVQVSDRRTDLNNSTNIVTFSKFGVEYINTVRENGITAYDLVLYPLEPIKSYSIDTFKKSFKPLEGVETSSANKSWIESSLENSKCLSHNYVYPESSDIYAIKNYYKLKAFISTTTKVTPVEGASVLANINKALVEKFNARNVDYGYEIPYDILLSTIENADERIKAVSLYEPELETKFLTCERDLQTSEYKEYSLFDVTGGSPAQDMFLTIVAKNVLSGRVSLYDYYDKFSFEFGQTSLSGKIDGSYATLPILIDNVLTVTTNTNVVIPSKAVTQGYTLLNNEVIQVVSPSLVTKTTYPYGINYYLYLNSPTTYIPNGTEYEMKNGELCVFEYTNSNDEQVVDIYKYDANVTTILKPNFDMYTVNYRITPNASYSNGETPLLKRINNTNDRTTITSVVSDALDSNNQLKMFTLSTQQQVEYRTVNKVSIPSSYCAWIMNNDDNEICWDANNEYMLREGEYFFQTDLGFNELLSYGSGTLIQKVGFVGEDWTNTLVDISALDDVGLLGHKEFFKLINVDENNTLTFQEQEITTLIEGDAVRQTNTTSAITFSDNSFIDISSYGIEYRMSGLGRWISLPTLNYSGCYQKMRCILDINSGPDTPQTLVGSQSMTFNDGTHTYTATNSSIVHPIIKLERLHQTYGGDNISLASININDSSNILYDTVCVYKIDEGYNSTHLDDNFEVLQLTSDNSYTHTYVLPRPSLEINKAILMVYVEPQDGESGVEVTFTGLSSGIVDLNTGETISSGDTISKGIHNLLLTIAVSNTLTFNSTDKVETLTIRLPRYLNSDSYNYDGLGITTYCSNTNTLPTNIATSLLTKIRSIDANRIFYFDNDIDNSKAIEYGDLASPYSFYDYNNVANKWTLSEIEFSESQPDISITRGSLIK